jgi:hypothetical protein
LAIALSVRPEAGSTMLAASSAAVTPRWITAYREEAVMRRSAA